MDLSKHTTPPQFPIWFSMLSHSMSLKHMCVFTHSHIPGRDTSVAIIGALLACCDNLKCI